jgi:hypothetical protein
MCVIAPDDVVALRLLIPAQTTEVTMRAIGVSWETWVKVREGRPVRLSTAARILRRLESAPRADRRDEPVPRPFAVGDDARLHAL